MTNRIQELKNLLQEASQAYYNEGESVLSDSQFDTLVKEYEDLTGEVYQSETAAPTGKKLVDVSHTFPNLVGTLDKAFDMKEFKEWFNDRIRDLPGNFYEILVTPKYDGNSVILTFTQDGKFNNALTRGKEGKGLDLSHFFKNVTLTNGAFAPTEEEKKGSLLGIKCEALLTYDNFNKIKELKDTSYANPRNLVAGILNSNDGYKLADYVNLAVLDVDFYQYTMFRYDDLNDSAVELTKVDKLVALEEGHIGLSNMLTEHPKHIISGTPDVIFQGLESIYNEYIAKRDTLPYMIDGLVIEFTDSKIRETLGRSGDRNKFDVALKFPYMEATTTIEDVEWDVGKTGRVTPVARIKPVYFNGAECVRISLANYGRFKTLNLKKGQPVRVGYHADVMAYLTVDPGLEYEGELFQAPEVCPVCGSKLEVNESGSYLFCKNETCESRMVGKFVNWLTKLDIKGIKDETIRKMVESLHLKNIEDLYKVTLVDLMGVDGFQLATASGIINALKEVNKIPDYQLFGSLGFTNLGRGKAKEIFSIYSISELLDENYQPVADIVDKLIKVDGVSEILAESFKVGVLKNSGTLKDILEGDYLTIDGTKERLAKLGAREKINVVFTLFRDNDLQARIELAGSKVTSGVSKKTNVVVTLDPEASTVKLKKARDLGIPILTPEEFNEKYDF